MGPSEKAFNQVKSILGKLDRNIEQLREQRKTPAPAAAAVQPPPGRTEAPKPVMPTPAYRPSNSAYGRATPIMPSTN
jgi:hypothetical protein